MPPLATMASPDVHRILAREDELARAANRPSPTLEDLVRAIALDPIGANVLRSSGADLDTLELALAHAATRLPSSTPEHDVVLRLAQLRATVEKMEHVTLDLLLHAILGRDRSRAVRLLAKHGASSIDVRRFLAHGIAKPPRRSSLPVAHVVHDATRTPERCKVVFINDNFTTRALVIEILCSLFDHPREQAERIATIIHEQGRVSVGDYGARKARRLAAKATRRAEKKAMPLLIVLEECD